MNEVHVLPLRLRLIKVEVDGEVLWYAENADATITRTVRATDRGAAIEKIREKYPHAMFSR